ncbi:MAG: hypothetical protein E6J70_02275 [Deltaproteobacteria bacterium]|nr:MAG: hypothetical protein E6K11_04210 [Euryarchaeota archaeon]TMB05416.1 MAG: hypothetical protein E6J70_02275 [Deltaproteobacteria bacterium]
MRRIDLIGCGGIGGHVARNLCRFLHSERRAVHVVVVDGDAYEERNRSRMSFTAPENKALLLGRELAAEFGDVLTIEPVPEYVTAANLASLIRDGDLVFLAVDNHATRRLVDGWCAGLGDVTLISGGNDGIEDGQDGTYGNVQVVRRAEGRALTSTLGRFHPEIREPGAPQLLFTNLAVASAMLNAFYGLLRAAAAYEEVYVDIVKNSVVPMERK